MASNCQLLSSSSSLTTTVVSGVSGSSSSLLPPSVEFTSRRRMAPSTAASKRLLQQQRVTAHDSRYQLPLSPPQSPPPALPRSPQPQSPSLIEVEEEEGVQLESMDVSRSSRSGLRLGTTVLLSPHHHHPHQYHLQHHKEPPPPTSPSPYLTQYHFHPSSPVHHLQPSSAVITSTPTSGGSGASSPSTERSGNSSSPRPPSSASTTATIEMASSLLDTDDDDEEDGHSSGDFIRNSTLRKGGSSFSELHLSPRRLSSSLSSHSSAPSSTSSTASSGHFTASSTFSTISSSSMISSSSSSPSISLATVLDIFQHPINEHQAWALVYLAALSLRQLVTDFAERSSSSGQLLKLVEVSDLADLLLTAAGAVHPSTWLSKKQNGKADDEATVITVKNSRSLNAAFAHLSGLIYKALTYKLPKSTSTEKKTSKSEKSKSDGNVLLETNLDSLSEFEDSNGEEEEEEDDDLELDINAALESVLIFMIRSKDDPHANLTESGDDHDHDGTAADQEELLGDDEGIDDDVEDEEEEEDVEISLSNSLAKSALPSVLKRCERHFEDQWNELLLKNAVASSNGDFPGSQPKLGSLNSTSTTCPILTMLYEGSRKKSSGSSKATGVDATAYYTAVIEQMLDEYEKLKQLLKQLEIEEAGGTAASRAGDDPDGGASSSAHGQLAFRRSSALLSKNRKLASELPDTENLKVWAQTWIKVMSEMRFGGIHLRQVNLAEPDPRMKPPVETISRPPFNALLEQIRSTKREQLRSSKQVHPIQQSTRQLLQHSRSLPCLDYRLTINQEVIQAKKNSLKPAARRKLAERPLPEPSLHERLMAEIKDQAGPENENGGERLRSRRLTSVETIVKPDIVELYFKERREIQKRRVAQSRSFPRVKSAIVLPRVHSPTFTKEEASEQQQQKKKFSMDELATSPPSSPNSSANSLLRLCGRCSGGNNSYKSPSHCLRHNSNTLSRTTSNPSFVHSVAASSPYRCTCQTTTTVSTNSINFEAAASPPPPPPQQSTSSRLFNSHFQANIHLRRSYIKSKQQQQQALQTCLTPQPHRPSSTFDQLNSSFQATSRLRRANSVMFHSKDRTSSTTSSVLSKSQSKWSFGNLFSKLTASIGRASHAASKGDAKVKRE